MKKIFLFASLLSIFAACTVKDKKANQAMTAEEKKRALVDTANFTQITWLDSTFKNLGKVNEGEIVEVTYRFKNTGDHNLVITDVHASCGCTTPETPQQPYAPGEEGVIKAKFDSNGRPGVAHKDVTVTANTLPSSTSLLTFEVEVLKK
jgi:hypothetical protein